MGAPVENETVFVRVALWSTGLAVRGVQEARVLRCIVSCGEFEFAVINAFGSGTKRIVDEGVTWARPEHVDALRVTVALSP